MFHIPINEVCQLFFSLADATNLQCYLIWYLTGWEVLATDASIAFIWIWKGASWSSLWEFDSWSKSCGCCHNRSYIESFRSGCGCISLVILYSVLACKLNTSSRLQVHRIKKPKFYCKQNMLSRAGLISDWW